MRWLLGVEGLLMGLCEVDGCGGVSMLITGGLTAPLEDVVGGDMMSSSSSSELSSVRSITWP